MALRRGQKTANGIVRITNIKEHRGKQKITKSKVLLAG